MKFLGIAYNNESIGIARSDDSGSMAFPEGPVETVRIFGYLKRMLEKKTYGGVIVGLFESENEQSVSQDSEMHVFVKKLKRETSTPIFFARRVSVPRKNKKQSRRSQLREEVAAALLQDYLSNKK